MYNLYQDYVSILKSFVHQSPLCFENKPAWDEIFRLATINDTIGIVGHQLMSNPGLVDTQTQAKMRHHCMEDILLYSQRAESMKELIIEMNKVGIDHLLFKGFILRDFYPVPELRTFGDIDFVIRLEDRFKSEALMKRMGYVLHNDWEPVFSYTRGAEYYEIHTDVMEIDVSEKADFKGYYKQIWDHTVNTNEHTYEFTPEFHLVYLLTHIAKHLNSSGAGIRMYLDIAFFVLHYENRIDWDFVQKQFAILKFEDFANIVFTAVEQWFDVKSPILLRPIDEEVMEKFLEFTLSGGVYGKVGRDASMKYLKNEDRSSGDVSKGRTLLRRLCPPASEIENRYTYLQGRHWLSPVAWVHRLIKTRSTWGEHAQQAKNIVNADDKEVLKMRKMYKEIGL